jgi:hypothetical protein
MECVLEWIKACPFEYRVSSYQSGAISIKVDVPENMEWAVKDGNYDTEEVKDERDS